MASSRYKHPHHQRIDQALQALNPSILSECGCYFGGGTAIALLLGEYRESVDIDFVCSSKDGFRRLRNLVTDNSLGALLIPGAEISLARSIQPIRRDQYGVRTWIIVDNTPIRLEMIQEARITVAGVNVPEFPVKVLARTDLFAEKLLANADRWSDASILYRDIIDLFAMTSAWGPIPADSWAKARDAYGASVDKAYQNAQEHLRTHPEALQEAFTRMQIPAEWQDRVRQGLGAVQSQGHELEL